MSFDEFTQALEQNIDGLQAGDLTPGTELEKLSQWDSLAVLTTIAMADADFGVSLTGEDVRGARTAGELHQLIVSRREG